MTNTRHVRPEARLKFRRDGLLPILGAENNMEHILGVCVGHVPHLRRSSSSYIMHPALYALGGTFLPRLRRFLKAAVGIQTAGLPALLHLLEQGDKMEAAARDQQ